MITQSLSTPDTVKSTDLFERMSKLLEALCNGLYEREIPVYLSLLSAIAGESIFLLGPPGVGKSLIARRLKNAFKGGKSFEYLMSKFSTPDEVFGPVSIKKLKEEDRYERLTDAYLPGANIVFLDEIWKAGPAIQNALLTILNEKIFRNGDQEYKVDIHSIISASNELPLQNTNLAPIWDRFLIRHEIGDIKKFKNFLNMITDTQDVYQDDIPKDLQISLDELKAWNESIKQIELGPEVLNIIQMTKIKIDDHNQSNSGVNAIIIHDRRWKKIVRLLRTSAFLNGRSNVDLMDCFLMKHCLWSDPTQRKVINTILEEVIEQHGYTLTVNISNIQKEVISFKKDVDKEIQIPQTRSDNQLMVFHDQYLQLSQVDGRFHGNLILIKDFKKLKLGEESIINFYDENQNLVNRINCSRGDEEHSIQLNMSNSSTLYHLKTKIIEKQEMVYKAPHTVVRQYWDQKYKQIEEYITEKKSQMDLHADKLLNGIELNLFVEDRYAEIVKSNFNRVSKQLDQARLDIEKIQYSYSHQ